MCDAMFVLFTHSVSTYFFVNLIDFRVVNRKDLFLVPKKKYCIYIIFLCRFSEAYMDGYKLNSSPTVVSPPSSLIGAKLVKPETSSSYP